MSVNTKEALLAELGEGSAMYQWGAIMALGRDTVNVILQAKFLECLSRMEVNPLITGTYYVDESRTEQVAFDDLMFGPPSLSFERASGQSNRIRVRMELIAGRCERWSMFPGEPKYLRRIHRLSPGLGAWLEFTADLVVIPIQLPHGRQLQLALDLRMAKDPTCSLAPEVAGRMGQFLLEQLLAQPTFAQAFDFLTIVQNACDVCNVVDATPITQRAPEGAGTGSMPETDGAVVLYLQLQGTGHAGFIPAAMPYLLPRKDNTIPENTGTALLIGKLRSTIGTEHFSRILSQLVFPSGSTIEITDPREPYDLIGFGELKPSASMAWLSPGLSVTAPGKRIEFMTNGAKMYEWQARALNTPRSAGAISDQGLYQPRPIEETGSAQRVTVVTANVSEAADAETRAALVIESTQLLTISPRVVSWYPGYDDIVLRASANSGLTWKLLGDDEPFGEIEYDPDDPHQVTFKPHEQNTPFVRLQRIEVSDGENTGYATIVLLGVGHRLDIEPYPIPRVSPGASLSFSLAEGVPAKWQVFGPGEIEGESEGEIGRYKAPATTNEEVSVVVAFAENFAGVAVIEHQTPAPVKAMALNERWKTLQEFTLERNNASRNMVFANGFAQVGIDIVLQTDSFMDSAGEVVWDPVSDDELASLVILDAIGNPIPYLTRAELGIPEGSPNTWMANKTRNKIIDYYPTNTLEEGERLHSEHEGRRVVTVYLHSREAETAVFSASFQDHNNGMQKSKDIDDVLGEIELEGIVPPIKDLKNFNWPDKGKRVAYEDGEDYEGDRFNYWHSTTDYWELTGNGISFVDVVFDSMSMLKWESEQRAETFSSYTGVAFKPRRPEEATEIPPGMNYQAELQLLANEDDVEFTGLHYGFKGQDEVTTGAILVTLERTSKMNFWDDYKGTSYRQVLKDSVKFTIMDNYGNLHKLRLLFSGEQDGRNYLELKMQ